MRQQRDILQALGIPDEKMIKSHVACRINGYCGGNGTAEDLENEPFFTQLPQRVQDRLKILASRKQFY